MISCLQTPEWYMENQLFILAIRILYSSILILWCYIFFTITCGPKSYLTLLSGKWKINSSLYQYEFCTPPFWYYDVIYSLLPHEGQSPILTYRLWKINSLFYGFFTLSFQYCDGIYSLPPPEDQNSILTYYQT